MAERAPPKTFLVLDEAQWFAHDSVAEMLRLGRRENAHVWMATQSLDALPEAVRAAVRTNVADFLVFRGSPEDARDLGRMVPALTLEMIWSQPRGHALALIGKGEHIATVRLIPPAPLPPERMEGRLEAVRETSRRFLPGRAPDPVSEHSQPPAADPANPSGRAMLLALWSELLDLDPGATVRVHLDDLRRAFDPEGTGVRDLGRTLRDSGGLIRSDRDEHGSFWEVGRAGFDRLLGPGVDPRELDAAARRWRERPREGGASSLS